MAVLVEMHCFMVKKERLSVDKVAKALFLQAEVGLGALHYCSVGG
jgi:hypothetical protein